MKSHLPGFEGVDIDPSQMQAIWQQQQSQQSQQHQQAMAAAMQQQPPQQEACEKSNLSKFLPID